MIFFRVKFNILGVIKFGISFYFIYCSSFGIYIVFMVVYMSFFIISYCFYNICEEGKIKENFLVLF